MEEKLLALFTGPFREFLADLLSGGGVDTMETGSSFIEGIELLICEYWIESSSEATEILRGNLEEALEMHRDDEDWPLKHILHDCDYKLETSTTLASIYRQGLFNRQLQAKTAEIEKLFENWPEDLFEQLRKEEQEKAQQEQDAIDNKLTRHEKILATALVGQLLPRNRAIGISLRITTLTPRNIEGFKIDNKNTSKDVLVVNVAWTSGTFCKNKLFADFKEELNDIHIGDLFQSMYQKILSLKTL